MFKDEEVDWAEDWFCEEYYHSQQNIIEMVNGFQNLSVKIKKQATLDDIRNFFDIRKDRFELFIKFAEDNKILSFSSDGYPLFDSDRVIYLTQNGECIFEPSDMEPLGYDDYQESFNPNRETRNNHF